MTLKAWHLKRLGKDANGALLIGVEGKRADLAAGSAVHKPWHSSSIVERVDSHTVRTASGATYLLLGPITSGAGLNAHLSADFVSFFADGFPEDWLRAISAEPKEGDDFEILTKKGEEHLAKKARNDKLLGEAVCLDCKDPNCQCSNAAVAVKTE